MTILITYPIINSVIFPVERNSVYTFVKELSINRNETIDHLLAVSTKQKVDSFELFMKRTTRYPLAIRDGLKTAEDLERIEKNKSMFYEYATQIEKKLLRGEVIVSDKGGIQFKPQQNRNIRLPIHMTASIIKSLSSLVIYLKFLAKENDLIIIDEPEINLHPDNQIILTRLFAELINKGFRILMSTHSDYIIREINNLILVANNKDNKDFLSKLGYKENEFIEQVDINVYYFDYPKKLTKTNQVTIEKLNIDFNGFDVKSIDNAIDKQNEITEELYYNYKYGNKLANENSGTN